MVIERGGRRVVTVDIIQENYTKIKAKATAKKLKVRQYVNDILSDYLEKEEFVHRIAPFLSIDSYEDNRITVKDVNAKVLVDVYYKDGKLWCEKDETTDCKHTQFVWMAPDIYKMISSASGNNSKKNRVRITV